MHDDENDQIGPGDELEEVERLRSRTHLSNGERCTQQENSDT
jgi:hypothetical protein